MHQAGYPRWLHYSVICAILSSTFMWPLCVVRAPSQHGSFRVVRFLQATQGSKCECSKIANRSYIPFYDLVLVVMQWSSYYSLLVLWELQAYGNSRVGNMCLPPKQRRNVKVTLIVEEHVVYEILLWPYLENVSVTQG